MESSKKEMPMKDSDLKISKKTRAKRLVRWLIIDFIVAAAIFGLLKYRPGRYKPLDPDFGHYESGQVSPYLTHQLSPQFYDGLQSRKPFDLVVVQDGVNDIISRANWPVESEGILLYAPAALLTPDAVVLMGTADVKGVEFVITIEIGPKIDEKGLLNLHVIKVKIGAMNITPLAKTIAKKMYMEKISALDVDEQAIQTKIAASLLNDEPFEPVFEIDGKTVQIEKIAMNQGQLTIHFVSVLKHGL
jgi:uncharacterized protein YpmS